MNEYLIPIAGFVGFSVVIVGSILYKLKYRGKLKKWLKKKEMPMEYLSIIDWVTETAVEAAEHLYLNGRIGDRNKYVNEEIIKELKLLNPNFDYDRYWYLINAAIKKFVNKLPPTTERLKAKQAIN